MFALYASIVKNLRGVVLFDLDEEGSWDTVEWLRKRFKYRDLGLTPRLVEKYRGKVERYLQGNPFRELTLPITGLERMVELLENGGVSREVSELLVFSSVYISPAMCIGEKYCGEVAKLVDEAVKVCKGMGVNDWKLHLRIADYSILDWYEKCVKTSMDVIRRKDPRLLEEVLKARAQMIEKDKKRYWRIECGGGRVFLGYVDLLGLYYRLGLIDRVDKPDYSTGLAIVPVVFIPGGMK
ncbi:hypothetical protein [Thermogladius sp.]|uniref:hypothetical protein n=1 Tax=Thermogladius sp. TaxID=2023064 RepID=UPI003D111E60